MVILHCPAKNTDVEVVFEQAEGSHSLLPSAMAGGMMRLVPATSVAGTEGTGWFRMVVGGAGRKDPSQQLGR